MIRAGRRAVLALAPALPGVARAQQAPADEGPIGTARMEGDGTIVLDLVARNGGVRGHARLVYPPSHPEYERILRHLGGLRPGEVKPVPPFS